jgi:hypothetical protein
MSQIWSFWEGPRPPFVDLCWRTVTLHNQDCRLVGIAELADMGGQSVLDLTQGMPHAIRSDLIRAWLLHSQGGIWLDADVIVLQTIDWQTDDYDLICVRNPNTRGIGARGVVACPWGCRRGSPIAADILARVTDRIQLMRAGHHVPYGDTSTGVLSRVTRAVMDRSSVQIRQHWRYCPTRWDDARKVYLRRGDWGRHEQSPAWRPGIVCYHLTNPIPHAYASLTEDQVLADNRFASFLLNKSLGNLPALPPRSWEILQRIPRDRPVVGVEVGVFVGNNAVQLLQQRPNLTLHLVDPWDVGTADYRSTADYQARFPRAKWDQVYAAARQRVAFAGERARVTRATSAAALATIADQSLDFAWLDANHSRAAVTADLLWARKVRPGGWIGGHDYHHPKARQRNYGVTEAVDSWRADRPITTGRDTTWFVQL